VSRLRDICSALLAAAGLAIIGLFLTVDIIYRVVFGKEAE
jgi:hypothetical protein